VNCTITSPREVYIASGPSIEVYIN